MAAPAGDKRPKRRTHAKGFSLLTDEAKAALLTGLKTGVPIPVAAAAANLSRSTVNSWLVNGRKAKAKLERNERITPYEAECVDLLTEANTIYEGVHLLLAGRVLEASRDDWRAATWMLQRRHPETWGGPERLEISGPGGNPIEIAEIQRRAVEYLEALPADELPAPNGQQ